MKLFIQITIALVLLSNMLGRNKINSVSSTLRAKKMKTNIDSGYIGVKVQLKINNSWCLSDHTMDFDKERDRDINLNYAKRSECDMNLPQQWWTITPDNRGYNSLISYRGKYAAWNGNEILMYKATSSSPDGFIGGRFAWNTYNCGNGICFSYRGEDRNDCMTPFSPGNPGLQMQWGVEQCQGDKSTQQIDITTIYGEFTYARNKLPVEGRKARIRIGNKCLTDVVGTYDANLDDFANYVHRRVYGKNLNCDPTNIDQIFTLLDHPYSQSGKTHSYVIVSERGRYVTWNGNEVFLTEYPKTGPNQYNDFRHLWELSQNGNGYNVKYTDESQISCFDVNSPGNTPDKQKWGIDRCNGSNDQIVYFDLVDMAAIEKAIADKASAQKASAEKAAAEAAAALKAAQEKEASDKAAKEKAAADKAAAEKAAAAAENAAKEKAAADKAAADRAKALAEESKKIKKQNCQPKGLNAIIKQSRKK